MLIKIPGIPFSQKRHRHTNAGNFTRVYDPSAKDKETVKNQVTACLYIDGIITRDQEYPLFGKGVAISVKMTFHMPIPQSYSKTKIKTILQGVIKHTSKPDNDNLYKFYSDTFNGFLYHDDSQIVSMSCTKQYSNFPQTIIEINPFI